MSAAVVLFQNALNLHNIEVVPLGFLRSASASNLFG
jgi:hypothetical protein